MIQVRFVPILPKGVNVNIGHSELAKTMRDLMADATQDMDKTVATWDQKPKVQRNFIDTTVQISFDVYIADEIYTYLEKGVSGHTIYPVRTRMLRFAPNTQSKTIRFQLSSRQGFRKGKAFSEGVYWPGIKPREWEKALLQKYGKRVPADTQSALNKIRP